MPRSSHPNFIDSIVGEIAYKKNWVFDLNTHPDNDEVWEVTYTTRSREESIRVEYRINPHTGGTYISKVGHRYADSSKFFPSVGLGIEDSVRLLGLVVLWMCS